MNRLFLFTILITVLFSVEAQNTITFRPGPSIGEDALLQNLHGCTPTGYSIPPEQMNFGNSNEIDYLAWTYNSAGCSTGEVRSLLRFSGLNTLPAGVTINHATLKLYGVQTSGYVNGNSSYSGSPFSTTNLGWVQRVTSNWTENSVTWNIQPSTTASNQVAIPMSTQQWNWNISLDVTDLVQDMIYFGNNYGFMLKLQNETKYRSILFASSDNSDSLRWPSLTVTYCDSRFTYCSSSNDPYTYNFSSVSNNVGNWIIRKNSQIIATGNGATFQYTFNNGDYQVCFNDTVGKCQRCINICVPENKAITSPINALRKTNYLSKIAPQNEEVSFGDKKLMTPENVKVSPNPTSKRLKVDLETVSDGVVSVLLTNIQGKKIKTFNIEVKSGKNTFYLSTNKLPFGTYILTLKKDQFTVHKKIIIN